MLDSSGEKQDRTYLPGKTYHGTSRPAPPLRQRQDKALLPVLRVQPPNNLPSLAGQASQLLTNLPRTMKRLRLRP